MDKKLVAKKVQALQNKALSLGMDWDLDQSPAFAERSLSDLISEVVDGTNEILDDLNNESPKTYRDLFKEIYRKYGIETSTQFHIDPDKELSNKEYQEELEAYGKVARVTATLGGNKK